MKTKNLVVMVLMTMLFSALCLNVYADTYGDFEYTVTDGEVTIIGYTGTGKQDVVIPSSINGYKVTKIADAFSDGCSSSGIFRESSILSVTLPDTLTYIGRNAFYDCSYLKSVEISNSVTSIGSMAFYNCVSLEEIIIPNSVTSIDNQAFYGCVSLENVTIPNSVTYIGSYVFEQTAWYDENTDEFMIVGDEILLKYNGTDRNVKIPTGVKYIYEAFMYNENILKVEIPNTVVRIDSNAFYGCSKLISVNIPDSVEIIRYCQGSAKHFL